MACTHALAGGGNKLPVEYLAFARRGFQPGDVLGEYTGEVRPDSELAKSNEEKIIGWAEGDTYRMDDYAFQRHPSRRADSYKPIT